MGFFLLRVIDIPSEGPCPLKLSWFPKEHRNEHVVYTMHACCPTSILSHLNNKPVKRVIKVNPAICNASSHPHHGNLPPIPPPVIIPQLLGLHINLFGRRRLLGNGQRLLRGPGRLRGCRCRLAQPLGQRLSATADRALLLRLRSQPPRKVGLGAVVKRRRAPATRPAD